MPIGETFNKFFDSTSIIVLSFSLMGIALIIAELFHPMKKLGAAAGYSLYGLSVLLRVLFDGTVGMVFIMVMFLCLVIFTVHPIMLKTQKSGWLSYARQLRRRSVQRDDILGLTGITTTRLTPAGNMTIGNTNFFVTADEPVEAGCKVMVTEIIEDKIIVAPVENGDREG